jgi:hypothetical protein
MTTDTNPIDSLEEALEYIETLKQFVVFYGDQNDKLLNQVAHLKTELNIIKRQKLL